MPKPFSAPYATAAEGQAGLPSKAQDYLRTWEKVDVENPAVPDEDVYVRTYGSTTARDFAHIVRQCWGKGIGITSAGAALGWAFIQPLKPAAENVEGRLQPIRETIRQSKKLLQLPEGWDEEAAKPIDPQALEAAGRLLMDMAVLLLRLPGNQTLAVPEINPVPNGSIDLSWRTARARTLINVRKEGTGYTAYYYGDEYNNVNPNKGAMPITDAGRLLGWLPYLAK